MEKKFDYYDTLPTGRFIAYDVYSGVRELRKHYGLGYWHMPSMHHVNMDCNVSVWMIPGTVDPLED